MDSSWLVLAASAVSVGFLHTVVGPDHYLPFVALAAARNWSRRKLLAVTLVCGSAHVLSSLVIALVVGGLMGLGVTRVEQTFGWQGSAVAWSLVVLGLAYAAWGVFRPHRHKHLPDGSHLPADLSDARPSAKSNKDVTVWALFLLFVFGPCEAMIPLVMLPSAQGSIPGIILVLGLFGVVTVTTMSVLVLALHAGVGLFPKGRLTRAAHPLAGVVIALCGVGILLGL